MCPTKATTTKNSLKKGLKTSKKDESKLKKIISKSLKNKKVTGKSSKSTASKKLIKKSVKKVVEKPEVSTTKFTKTEKFIAEAIASLQKEDSKWVSDMKIVDYFKDYMEGGIPATYSSRVHKTLKSLLDKKLLKANKKKYQFSSLGEKKLKPSKLTTRNKINRPVKAEAPPEEKPQATVQYTNSGRASKSVVK
jgi:seryl-tRNA synthetase